MASAPPPPSIDVVAGAGRDRVGGRRARHRQRRADPRSIQAFEIGDADAVARRLIRSGADGEIDRGDTAARGQHQCIGPEATVDRGLRASVGHAIVSAAGADSVGPAGAVDGVVAAAAGDRIGRRRARDRDRRGERRRVDVLEIGDVGRIARGHVGIAEVDGNGGTQRQRIGADDRRRSRSPCRNTTRYRCRRRPRSRRRRRPRRSYRCRYRC